MQYNNQEKNAENAVISEVKKNNCHHHVQSKNLKTVY